MTLFWLGWEGANRRARAACGGEGAPRTDRGQQAGKNRTMRQCVCGLRRAPGRRAEEYYFDPSVLKRRRRLCNRLNPMLQSDDAGGRDKGQTLRQGRSKGSDLATCFFVPIACTDSTHESELHLSISGCWVIIPEDFRVSHQPVNVPVNEARYAGSRSESSLRVWEVCTWNIVVTPRAIPIPRPWRMDGGGQNR